MENASKALVIAGGVLIAVMLAILVYYVFTYWGDSQRLEQEGIEAQRASDFNKSYLSYEKVLYGSELLGLVNKMNDYNKSSDVKYGSYDEMSLTMQIKELSGSTGNLFSAGTYDLDDINEKIENVMNETVYDSRFAGKVSDSQWEYLAKSSSSTDSRFQELCTQLNVNATIDRSALKQAAAKYYEYIQFKRMKFDIDDNNPTTFFNNGRVESMHFVETR